MNKKLMPLLAGSVLALSTVTASAVPIDLGTLSVDVTQGTFTNVVDAGGESGVRWDSDFVSFSPITINDGDSLNVGFEFLAGQTLELISGAYARGSEIFQYREPGSSVSNSATTTVSFTGVEGDLNAPGEFTTTGSAGFINGTVGANATDTSFAFHDIHFLTDFFNFPSGESAEVSQFRLRITATDINAHVSAPEPSILALISLGLVGLGFSRRKKAA